MNILFVLENYLPHIGGVEIVFKNLCEGLVKEGHRVTIVTHRLKGTKRKEKQNGVNIRRVSCFGSRYLFTFFSIPTVLKYAKNADLIHTTTFTGAPPAWLAGKLKKKPVILTVHEVWIGRWRELTDLSDFSAKIHDFLERMIYKLNFNQYITVSNSTKNMLKGIKPESKITTIYNGIEYDHFIPQLYTAKAKKIKNDLGLQHNYILLTYGRPGVSKGIKYSIQAMPHILNTIATAKLILILSKDPAYKKQYQQLLDLIDELKLKQDIIILDPKPWKELPAYLQAADCVIVPSLAEGFGFTAAEACAMRRPVVASNTTSLPEVVSGFYYLSKPRDPKSIAKGVDLIYHGKITNRGKKKFLWKDAIEKTIEVYGEILGKKL